MSVTLEDLRREHPEDALLLVLGQDAFNGLDRWHEWRRLFDLTHFVVMTRPGEGPRYAPGLEAELAGRWTRSPDELGAAPAGRVHALAVTPLDISSTRIRQAVAAGEDTSAWLDARVRDYIEREGLYAG